MYRAMSTRSASTIGALLFLVALLLSLLIPTGTVEAQTESSSGKVLVVAVPRLTWEEVEESEPANLVEFFSRSATAMSSPRTIGSVTTPGEAYLTIGAGNRASVASSTDGHVVDVADESDPEEARQAFESATGRYPSADIFALGMPSVEATNDELLFGSVAGSLGSAIRDGDKAIGVVANADRTLGVPKFRHAALAAIDDNGEVFSGDVSQSLLEENPNAAYGLQLNSDAVLDAFDETWAETDVTLVELSDLERAESQRLEVTTERGDEEFAAALERSDELFGELLERADLSKDLVIVIAPSAPDPKNEMTVFAIGGPEMGPGLATSSTTRRDGYVSLTDIAPTILDYLDLEIPSAVGNTRISSNNSGENVEERIEWMSAQAGEAFARDDVFAGIATAYVVLVIAMMLLSIIALAYYKKMGPWLRYLALALLALMPVTYLLGLVPLRDAPRATLAILVAVGSVLLAAASSTLSRFGKSAAPMSIFALLWLTLAIDVVTGSNLQIDTVFGYSPIVAGRFAGFGNQAYSLFALSTLLLAAYFVQIRTPKGEPASRSTLGAVGAFYLVTIVLDGHPSFGSDVGGVLSFTPAAVISILMFARKKIKFTTLAIAGIITVVVISGFALADLTRDAESQTHLGRFATQLVEGEAGEILQRKLSANLRLLTAIWTWIVPGFLLYLGYLNWRPPRTLKRLQGEQSQLQTFSWAALTLGVTAMALNDSGLSMPAMMMGVTISYLTYLVMGDDEAFAQKLQNYDA